MKTKTESYVFYTMLILVLLLIPPTSMLLNETNYDLGGGGLGRAGRIIVTSCAANQFSLSTAQYRGGYNYTTGVYNKTMRCVYAYSDFTHHFLRATTDATMADTNQDGDISVEEMFYYAKDSFYAGQQTPQIYDGIQGDVSLAPSLNKKNYALLVGTKLVDEFVDDSIYTDFGLYNTKNVNNVIVNKYSFDPLDIKFLTDGAATRMNIKNSIMFLGEKIKPGDTMVFYFSGHGNTDCISAEDGMITDKELGCWFNNIKPDVNVIIIIDSCHSGSMI